MSFRVIDISGVTPFERGEQHGKGARQLIERGIRAIRKALRRTSMCHGTRSGPKP